MANVDKMLWKEKPDVQMIQHFTKNTLLEQLGIVLTEIGHDYIKATMPVDVRTMQPMGLLHGGASVALSESIGSIASWLIVMGESKEIVGVEVNANHLRAVRSGPVTSLTQPLKIGASLHIWETRVFDPDENLACISRLTVMVRPAKSGQNNH